MRNYYRHISVIYYLYLGILS